MPSEFSFSLSLAAVDLLWEQLGLGSPIRIFEIPSVGQTMEDRARLRQIVLEDLASRNLVYRGRLEPEVEEALITVGRFQVAVDVVAMLNKESRLLARVASNGRIAVLARLRDQTVSFDTYRAEALVSEAVRLIGDEKPGPGRSVTFPEADPDAERKAAQRRRRDDDDFVSGVFEPSGREQGGYDQEKRAAQTMWERPRKRIGMFTVYGRDRNGREVIAPVLSWFDTDDGRYFGHSRPGPDGKQWTTYSPTDSARIGQQLTGMLGSVNQAAAPRR